MEVFRHSPSLGSPLPHSLSLYISDSLNRLDRLVEEDLTTSVNKLYSIRINQVRCTHCHERACEPQREPRSFLTVTGFQFASSHLQTGSVCSSLSSRVSDPDPRTAGGDVCRSPLEVAQRLHTNIRRLAALLPQEFLRQEAVNEIHRVERLRGRNERKARPCTED